MIRLNVAPLLVDHVDEMVEDLTNLYKNNIIDSTAFIFTLVPEGNPVFDKASECVRRFKLFQEKLKTNGVPTGILIQASMGHGWVPNSKTPWQKLARLDGTQRYTFCPEDDDFRNYVFDAVTKCAKAEPDFMMLDDDTRLVTSRNACFCQKHTDMFNRINGTGYSPDDLRKAVGENINVAKQFDAVIRETMNKYARLIRDAIDQVNPSLFCSFCQCYYDTRFSADIARILAGENNKPLIRINNGLYLNANPRRLPGWLFQTAEQIATLPQDITIIAEPDTCPQNRYSTSATFMRTHLLLSMLEGARGGKLWITRTGNFEPSSGVAYRKALMQDAGMMETVCNMNLDWKGPAVPFSTTPVFYFGNFMPERTSWSYLFSYLGFPFQFTRSIKDNATQLLTKFQVASLSDDELKLALSKNVLLDGAAAIALTERGFASLCGCTATTWDKGRCSIEIWNGEKMTHSGDATQACLAKHDGAQELSSLFFKGYAFDDNIQYLAPGAVEYKNELGGHVITVAAFTYSDSNFTSVSLFNEVRKRQLLAFLETLAPLELYFVGDEEVTLRYATDTQGNRIAYAVNIGLDVLESIKLKGTWTQQALPQVLSQDGKWKNAPFSLRDGCLCIDVPTLPARVTVFRL